MLERSFCGGQQVGGSFVTTVTVVSDRSKRRFEERRTTNLTDSRYETVRGRVESFCEFYLGGYDRRLDREKANWLDSSAKYI